MGRYRPLKYTLAEHRTGSFAGGKRANRTLSEPRSGQSSSSSAAPDAPPLARAPQSSVLRPQSSVGAAGAIGAAAGAAGVVMAWFVLVDLSAYLSPEWGRLMLVKLGVVLAAFFAVCVITYFCFVGGNVVTRVLGTNFIMVISRIMGLILAVVGTQMLIDGVRGAAQAGA